jgi:hypothetical protein
MPTEYAFSLNKIDKTWGYETRDAAWFAAFDACAGQAEKIHLYAGSEHDFKLFQILEKGLDGIYRIVYRNNQNKEE